MVLQTAKLPFRSTATSTWRRWGRRTPGGQRWSTTESLTNGKTVTSARPFPHFPHCLAPPTHCPPAPELSVDVGCHRLLSLLKLPRLRLPKTNGGGGLFPLILGFFDVYVFPHRAASSHVQAWHGARRRSAPGRGLGEVPRQWRLQRTDLRGLPPSHAARVPNIAPLSMSAAHATHADANASILRLCQLVPPLPINDDGNDFESRVRRSRCRGSIPLSHCRAWAWTACGFGPPSPPSRASRRCVDPLHAPCRLRCNQGLSFSSATPPAVLEDSFVINTKLTPSESRLPVPSFCSRITTTTSAAHIL